MNQNSLDIDGDLAWLLQRSAPRRLLTLVDEVGHIRPGGLPPAHTETPDERAERLSQEAQAAIFGEPWPLWAHAVGWAVLIAFTVGVVAGVIFGIGK